MTKMKKSKSHLLEFSSPYIEVMLLKISKKKFTEILNFGIERDDFEELASKLEGETIFAASTVKSGGYYADLHLDGEPVVGFDSHLQKLLKRKVPDTEPTIALNSSKSNRTTYYVYWNKFFKSTSYHCRFKDDFNLDKLSLFFPRDVLVGDETLSGFEVSYGDDSMDDSEELDFGGDELWLIDSTGKKFQFCIND
jgi:hypothetical protein